jgi:hypothetical protein
VFKSVWVFYTVLGRGGGEELTRGSTAAGAEGAAAARETRETRATENFILKVVVVGKTEFRRCGSCLGVAGEL